MIAVPAEALESLTLTTALAPVGRRRVRGAGRAGACGARATPGAARSRCTRRRPASRGSGDGVAPPIASLRGWDDVSLAAGGPVDARLGALRRRARHARASGRSAAPPMPLRRTRVSLLAHARLPAERPGRVAPARRRGRRGPPVRRRARGSPIPRRARSSARCTRRPRSPAAGRRGRRWRAALAYQEARRDAAARASPATVEIERLRDGPVPELYASRRRVRRFDLDAPRSRPTALRFGGRNEATRRRRPRAIGRGLERRGRASRGLTARASWTDAGAGLGLRGRGRDAARTPATSRSSPTTASPSARSLAGGRAALRAVARRRRDRRGPHRLDDAVAAHRRAMDARRARSASSRAGSASIPAFPCAICSGAIPGAPQGRVYRWDDDGDGRFEAGEQGPLVAVVGPGRRVLVHRRRRCARRRPPGVVAGFDLRPADGLVDPVRGHPSPLDRPRRVREHRRHRRRLRPSLHRRSRDRHRRPARRPPAAHLRPRPRELRPRRVPAHQCRRPRRPARRRRAHGGEAARRVAAAARRRHGVALDGRGRQPRLRRPRERPRRRSASCSTSPTRTPTRAGACSSTARTR